MRDTHANTKRRNFEKFPLFLIHCIKIVRGDVGKKYKKKKKKFEKRKFQKKKKSIRKDADWFLLLGVQWTNRVGRFYCWQKRSAFIWTWKRTLSPLKHMKSEFVKVIHPFFIWNIFSFFFFNSSIKTILSRLNPQRAIPTIMASFCAER